MCVCVFVCLFVFVCFVVVVVVVFGLSAKQSMVLSFLLPFNA